MNPALSGWLAFWRARQRYHRYGVVGLDRLDTGRAMLLVGYHGRPLAYDQCMLSVTLYDRFGYMPHGVIHKAVDSPILSWLKDGLGFVTGDGQDIADAVGRGEHIAVQPGGTREGCRSFRHRNTVDWGKRTGYIRLALRHRLPVVPIAARGGDWSYIGLNNGYKWGKRLGAPAGLPVWVGLGPLGIWPLSPPFPVRITTHIGEPIDLQDDGELDPTDPVALTKAHHRVARAVQALVTKANA